MSSHLPLFRMTSPPYARGALSTPANDFANLWKRTHRLHRLEHTREVCPGDAGAGQRLVQAPSPAFYLGGRLLDLERGQKQPVSRHVGQMLALERDRRGGVLGLVRHEVVEHVEQVSRVLVNVITLLADVRPTETKGCPNVHLK